MDCGAVSLNDAQFLPVSTDRADGLCSSSSGFASAEKAIDWNVPEWPFKFAISGGYEYQILQAGRLGCVTDVCHRGNSYRQKLRTLNGHSGYIQSMAFSAAGNTLATGGYDRTVRLWSVGDRARIEHH